MIRRLTSEIKIASAVVDGLFVVGCFVLASVLRFQSHWVSQWDAVLLPWRLLLLAYAVLVVVLFWSTGLYEYQRLHRPIRLVGQVMRSMLAVLVVTFGVFFAFRQEDISRTVIAFFFISLAASVFTTHLLFAMQLSRMRRQGTATSNLLVVGAGPEAKEFVDVLTRHSQRGVDPVGFVAGGTATLDGLTRLGGLEDIEEVLSTTVIDEVAVCLSAVAWRDIEAVASICREMGKAVVIPIGSLDRFLLEGQVDSVDGLSVVYLANGPDRAVALTAKRGFDIITAALLLVLLSPVLLVCGLVLVIVDGRPILYRQMRGGLHGRPFSVLKFRTMVTDADERKADLMAQNERMGPAFKVTDDPRVTRFGRFLRKWSIDEVPQLWNVVVGDMSLVGPRPQPIEEVKEYDLWHRRRLSVAPGITGLWQVSARGDPDFDKWVKLDLEYIDNWSLMLDLVILVKTPLAVIRSPGE